MEERERTLATLADEMDRKGVMDAAKSAVAFNQAPAAQAPPAPPGAMVDSLPVIAGTQGSGLERFAGATGRALGELEKKKADKPAARRSAKWGKEVYMALGTRGERQERAADFGDEGEPAQARERFVETAYWNPLVKTGADGKTKVIFKAPTALSEYRITARGVTGADTLAGQTTSALTVRKSFSVDLKVPSSLTQGDKPRFIAQVQHTGIAGKIELRLAIYAGGRDEVYPKTLEVTKDGIDEVLFDPFEVPEGESVRLTLKGAAGATADELTVEIPIRPWGVQVTASESGTSRESATVFVGLPAGRSYDSPEMLIVVSPSVKRMLIELALEEDAFPLFVRSHLNARTDAEAHLAAALHHRRPGGRAAGGNAGV